EGNGRGKGGNQRCEAGKGGHIWCPECKGGGKVATIGKGVAVARPARPIAGLSENIFRRKIAMGQDMPAKRLSFRS
ncbi:hypothetical protein, partial [Shigella flexneri]|uniref:hypothetical protein n=1 Tax=Shigella flexneri TaxID=623 RepID=UPI001C0A76B2